MKDIVKVLVFLTLLFFGYGFNNNDDNFESSK